MYHAPCYTLAMHKFVVTKHADHYSWTLYAPNGESVCHSDPYATEGLCVATIDYLKTNIARAVVTYADQS